MTADEALHLQARLEMAGTRVRVERLGGDQSRLPNWLALPPPAADAAGLMHCPACGRLKENAHGERRTSNVGPAALRVEDAATGFV